MLDKLKDAGKKTRKTKERADGRRRISEQINSNPELAVETAEEKWKSGAFEDAEYENCLSEIIQKTDCIDAMAKLAEFYGIHGDDEKCRHWQKKAAEAGNASAQYALLPGHPVWRLCAQLRERGSPVESPGK